MTLEYQIKNIFIENAENAAAKASPRPLYNFDK